MSENIPGKKISKWTLLAMNIGSMVGAGVVSLVGQAIGLTGHSAWVAYALALLMGTLYNIPVLYATGTLRLEGGPYALINSLLGRKFAGMYVVSFFLYFPCVALYAVALGTYVKSLLPSVPINVVAAIALTLFYLVNLSGMDILSKAQNVMSAALLVGLATFIIMGLSKADLSLMWFSTNENFMPDGFKGIFSAACLLMFSTYGHYMMMFFTRHSKNPKKDIAFAIKNTILILIVFYLGVTIVASSVLPLEVVANQPLTYVAREVLPKPLYLFFMIAGPFMALATTINACLAAYVEPIYTATLQGWFPKSLGTVNKKGSPVILLTMEWLCTMIPLILGWDINTITNTYLLVDLAMGVLMIFSIALIPKKYPKAWSKRQFMSKSPMWVFYLFVGLALLVQLTIIINSITSIKLYIVIATFIAFTIGILYAIKKDKDKDILSPDLDVNE